MGVHPHQDPLSGTERRPAGRFRKLGAAVAAVAALVAGTAAQASAQYVEINNVVVEQRADPAVIRHSDGYYYMTASVPDYKRLELRRSTTLQGLGSAATSTVFTAPSTGPLSGWIWAPDVRFHDGAWYLYFSASPSNATFDQRLYYMKNTSANPMTGTWSAPQRMYTHVESFQLDPATFELGGRRYFTWAQKDPNSGDNSHVFIARMTSPTTIDRNTVATIARPTYAWEREGYPVAEGPQTIIRNGRVFIAYSVAATDSRYKLGLVSASTSADLTNPASWTKSATPVFSTANGVYGPGHGSFTVAEDGKTDILVYHGRDYADPYPDALRDPNRHTRMQQLFWSDNGYPFFGQPMPNGRTPLGIKGAHSGKCVDNWAFDKTPGALVRLYDCNGNTAQQFEFNYLGNRYYEIRNRNTGTCLDNANGSTALNANVGLYPCNGTTAQQWGIRDRGNGWFQLYNVAGRTCLDNYEWNTANGARISLYTCNTGAAQMWRRG
ncbi:GH43 family beta-xylosidase [Kineococcus xinjiangensis]|uniref:GH43 family beta-xylosidase n=1 Tax=Kineococcus xinjiangensis TaxID=512762 RepID=A0A2S6IG12_9ACTN|nr:family 43 glycosylhydrolase [Kineococcus xinjiangensis]PPK93143.1 GH43 family beta-xylosidase [Kineococcus xinjiangensis]